MSPVPRPAGEDPLIFFLGYYFFEALRDLRRLPPIPHASRAFAAAALRAAAEAPLRIAFIAALQAALSLAMVFSSEPVGSDTEPAGLKGYGLTRPNILNVRQVLNLAH